ncbi:MAG: hybrid sensor histidine kinase/response regulator [Burkholderiaceae bacterium]|nr:hybrid sensor histidine kinase/response regulator [Burkholderiaceae bacterium]
MSITAASAADLSTPGLPALDSGTLAERVDALRLQLVSQTMLRVPAILLVSNLFSAWLLWRTGWERLAPVWFVAMSAVHFGRWWQVKRWQHQPPATPAAGNRVLAWAVMGVGVMQSLLVVGVFAGPHTVEHYLVTTHCAGVAAYAVVATGWRPKLLAQWIALVGGVLVAGWLLQADLIGVAMALMTVSMLATLLAQAAEQERALHRSVSLAWDNEQLAASLRVERDRAQAASESKTRFFAAASHDLRQPLHALSINAFALAMLARRHGEPKIVKLSDSIERALRQSTGLLDGLLDVSRLDAGSVQAHWSDIDLGPLLDGIASEFRPLAAQGGLALTVERPDAPLVVRSDADLLRRVLTNLLGNALKFTRQGGVTLIARADGERVLLAVEDTGIGISVADQGRVFEEFYQADNPARDRSQGLGLGLSIVRRIAALLDIELQLDSESCRGTRITLRLPPGAAIGVAQPFAAEAGVIDAAGLPTGLRVLVIDDEADIRDSMQALLEQLGCEPVCVEDLAAAQARVRGGFAPQLLLADHRLRQGDGLAALAALRAELGPLPAMLVTGDTAPATLAALAASGHRVLHKPLDGATLAQALRELGG